MTTSTVLEHEIRALTSALQAASEGLGRAESLNSELAERIGAMQRARSLALTFAEVMSMQINQARKSTRATSTPGRNAT